MKKLFGLLTATFVMGIALPVLAASSQPELHLNVRFLQTDDNTYNNSQAENRMQFHTVELTASQQVDNIGGSLYYRIADAVNSGFAANESYPVEAKVFYQSGAYKLTGGLQFVPFGIYQWNNLYVPFADIPGEKGHIWDSDWGYLFTYNSKPLLIDLGWWDDAGETQVVPGTIGRETPEKNTFTGRIGYDILSNLNLGLSYMNGSVDIDPVNIDIPPATYYIYDNSAQTKKKQWAVDTTWGIVPNLQAEAEYVDYSFKSALENVDADGNFGLVQLKYDILKVPSPLNKVSLVGQYSWGDESDKLTNTSSKTKNYQEEIWFSAGKNLDIFWQNIQEKVPGNTEKYYYLAFMYSFQ
jgi:hypothetical protein